MTEYIEVIALVEGKTEHAFISEIVNPYLINKKIFLRPIIASKPGQKGGDVRFARIKNDIEKHLKQRSDTYLTLFVDYYGIKGDWPGIGMGASDHATLTAFQKAKRANDAALKEVCSLFERYRPDKRFIPYIAMYEFEALLFSDPAALAGILEIPHSAIDKILRECGHPENINDSPDTAPSKRIAKLRRGFKKTTDGIEIAKAIGLSRIREKCPIFNEWLSTIEKLEGLGHGEE